MFLRLLRDSFLRRRRRKLLAVTALGLGTAVTMAGLSLALDTGDKVARELRSFGANIVVRPQADTLPLEVGGVDLRPLSEGSFLHEEALPQLKDIFWRNNILAFAPTLKQSAALADGRPVELVGTWFAKSIPLSDGGTFVTGLKALHPTWQVAGSWPADGTEPEALVGAAVPAAAGAAAWRPGQEINVEFDGQRYVLRMRGTLTTGSTPDRQIFVPLAWLQQQTGHAHLFRQLEVSALTTPENELARRNPASMTPAEYDRWYCTPYVSAIAHQIEEILPGSEATPVYRVAQAETAILGRVDRLLVVVSLAALLAAILVVMSTMTTSILERRSEVALMKALGGAGWLVSALFMAEATLLGLVGGALGYAAGLGGAELIARSVFGAPVAVKPVLLPLMLLLGVATALAGSLLPLRTVQRTDPALVLKEK